MVGIRPALTLLALALAAGCAHGGPVRAKGLGPAYSTLEELEGTAAPRRVAVLIGVDTYRHPELGSLKWAASDAERLGALLAEPAAGGFDRVEVLAGPERTGRATLLSALREAGEGLLGGDILVVYFSGHGTLARSATDKGTRFLLAADSDPGALDETAIELDALRTWFGDLLPQRKALIIDACFNGIGKSVVDPSLRGDVERLGRTAPGLSAAALDLGEAHLHATSPGRPAYEDDELQRGVYTHFLLQAMSWARGDADRDGDGVLTAWEAHDFARRGVLERTAGVQMPDAVIRSVGRYDVVLVGDPEQRAASDTALVFDYSGSRRWAGASLVVDGRPKGTFPGVVPVPPGRHHLEVRAPGGELLLHGYADLAKRDAVAAADLGVRTKEDRVAASLRVGWVGGPPSAWGALIGTGALSFEAWAAFRKALPPARGLFLGGTLGLGINPSRAPADLQDDRGRALLWAAANAGWAGDFRRLRLRAGWEIRATFVGPPGAPGDADLERPEDNAWLFASTGPLLHLGVLLDQRAALVAAGSLQLTGLDLDASGEARPQLFGSLGLGLELGF